MHFQQFHCIPSYCILHLLHGTAYIYILTHSYMLHSGIGAFACLHTHFQCCIWYKVHSCAFKCIQIWMHFHSLLHSRAFNARDGRNYTTFGKKLHHTRTVDECRRSSQRSWVRAQTTRIFEAAYASEWPDRQSAPVGTTVSLKLLPSAACLSQRLEISNNSPKVCRPEKHRA